MFKPKQLPFMPPPKELPIIQKLIITYKLWHGYFIVLDKIPRFSIGTRIDDLFLEVIEAIFTASHSSVEQKTSCLDKASDRFDLLKFMLRITWEIKVLDNKRYIALSQHLQEVGRMLGGWQKKTKPRMRF